jgi:predicted TIM-barrel fold metal-dependent hydrolase
MKSYAEFVGQLQLSEAHRRKILYENARCLFRLPLPPLEPSAGG